MAGPARRVVDRAAVKILPDTTGFAQKVKAKLKTELRGVSIGVSGEPKFTKVETAIKRLRATTIVIPARVSLDAKAFRTELRALLRDRTLKVNVKTSGGSLDQLRRLANGFGGGGSGPIPPIGGKSGGGIFANAAGAISRYAAVLAALGAVVASLLPLIAGLAQVLAAVGKAAVLLAPGAVSATAAVVGSLAVAVLSAKKAGGDAGKVFSVFSSSLGRLKKSSEQLARLSFAGLTAQAEQASVAIEELYKRNLPALGAANNKIFAALFRGVSDKGTIQSLDRIAQAAARLSSSIGDGLSPLIQGLAKLSAIGAEKIAESFSSLGRTMFGFLVWVERMERTGGFDKIFSDAGIAASGLLTTLVNLSAGFSVLGQHLTGGLPQFTQSMVAFSASFREFASSSQVENIITPIYEVLSALLQLGGSLVRLFSNILAPLLTQFSAFLTPTFEFLRSTVQKLNPFFVQLGAIMQSLADEIAPAFTQGLAEATPYMSYMASLLLTLIPTFRQLARVVSENRDVVRLLGKAVGFALVGALTALIVVVGAAANISLFLVRALGAMGRWVSAATSAVVSFTSSVARSSATLGMLGSLLVSAGVSAIQGFVRGFSSGASAVYAKAREIVSRVKSIFTGAVGFNINSPSRWAKDYVTGNVLKGFGAGFSQYKDRALSPAKAFVDQQKNSMVTYGQRTVNAPINYYGPVGYDAAGVIEQMHRQRRVALWEAGIA